jgi:hypothetical protein
MTADFWRQRKMHQIECIHLFENSCIGISVPIQNMFPLEATKETQDQQKTKIAYR